MHTIEHKITANCVTTASGMNLFNLIRFEKYGGGDPSLRAIENSNSTLRLLSKNNRGGGEGGGRV